MIIAELHEDGANLYEDHGPSIAFVWGELRGIYIHQNFQSEYRWRLCFGPSDGQYSAVVYADAIRKGER
jgi:hypothetical protein